MKCTLLHSLTVYILLALSLYGQDLAKIEGVFWNDSKDEVFEAVFGDLEGKTDQLRNKRLREYWNTLKAGSLENEVSNIDNVLSVLADRANNKIPLAGERNDKGIFVRDGYTEREARTEMIRGWIIMKDPGMAEAFIGSRLNNGSSTREDVINYNLLTEYTNPDPEKRFKLSDLKVYAVAANPIYRLMAVEQAVGSQPEGLDSNLSETNEYSFRVLIEQKKFLQPLTRDKNRIIAEEATSKINVLQGGIDHMVKEFGFAEINASEEPGVQDIEHGDIIPQVNEDSTGQRQLAYERPGSSSATSSSDQSKEHSSSFPWLSIIAVLAVILVVIVVGLKILRN